MNYLQRRKLFIVWNKAIAKARTNPNADKIVDRLNKALGILQHHDYYVAEKSLYLPTFASCGCPDWQWRGSKNRDYTGPCKHMAAEILLARMNLVHYEQENFLAICGTGKLAAMKAPVVFTGKIFVKGITA